MEARYCKQKNQSPRVRRKRAARVVAAKSVFILCVLVIFLYTVSVIAAVSQGAEARDILETTERLLTPVLSIIGILFIGGKRFT